jgi:hypothetical protein
MSDDTDQPMAAEVEQTPAVTTAATDEDDQPMLAAGSVSEAPAAAAPAAVSLDDLMGDDGGDELAQEQIELDRQAAAEAEAAVEAEAAAMETDQADGAAAGEGEGEGEEGGEADSDVTERLREALKGILAGMSHEAMEKTGAVKEVMKQLKDVVGKSILKANKDLAKRLAKEAAQARLAEVAAAEDGAAAAAEGGDDAAEDEDAREPIGDEEEDDDDDDKPKSKAGGKKRLRKAGGSDEDEDYDEKRAPKKSKKNTTKKPASAAAGSSGTVALLGLTVPKSALQIFQQRERRVTKEEHPDATPAEITNLLQEKWNALDPDAKGEYDQIATRQKEEYKKALKELKESDPEAYEAHQAARKKAEKKAAKDDEEDGENGGGGEGGAGEDTPLSYFDSIVKDLKTKKQTKSELSTEEQKDVAVAFIYRMEAAADADVKAIQEKKPAVARLKMLGDVQAQVSKPRVAELLLNEGLLKVFNRWLAPEADGALPNVKLRTTLYGLLATLNVNEQYLENSRGLGKRVLAIWNDPSETLANKRLLESLIQKWMRPMLGLSTDYNKLSELDEERGMEILSRKHQLDAQKPARNYNPKRSMMPAPAKFDYAIRPQANRDHEDEAEEARDASKARKNEPESKKEEMRKKMERMRKGATTAKPKFKVDITGRASTY